MANSTESHTIFVTENAEKSAPEHDEVFVIQEKISEVSRDRHDRLYALISDIDIGRDFDTEIFHIVWVHIFNNRDGKFKELIFFALQLQTYIEANSPERIVCSPELDRGYQAVVRDVTEEFEVDVSKLEPSVTFYHRLRRCLVTTIFLFPFLLDQLASLLIFSFRERPTTKTVFVPSLGRLDSMLPVLDRISWDHEIVISANASSLWWIFRDTKLNDHNPVPASAYTSVTCLREQLSVYKDIIHYVFLTGNLSGEISSEINKKTNVKLDNVVAYSIIRTFRTRLCISVLLYVLYRQLISKTECESVVTGGLDPGGRALICAGLDVDITAYHIPHGTAPARVENPPPDLISFISGSVDKRHYMESPQVISHANLINTGRPYLTDLYNQRTEYQTCQPLSQHSEKLRILLATQPLPGERSFVINTIAAIEENVSSPEIVIKLHPSEHHNKYRSIAAGKSNVSIVESNLFDELGRAELTVTVNSNVGVESIIVGTPTVVINERSPINLDPNYSVYGPIPSLHTQNEVHDFFHQISPEYLSKLHKKELDFVEQGYKLDCDAEKNMIIALNANKNDLINCANSNIEFPECVRNR